MKYSIFSLVVLLFFFGTNAMDVTYKKRGDHYEGTKKKEISSGYGITAISFVVPSQKNKNQNNQSKIAFFLPSGHKIHDIIIQEKKPKKFYWLDQFDTTINWKTNGCNTYSWDSAIIKKLNLSHEKLAVMIKLRSTNRATKNINTPAILYNNHTPNLAEESYRIYFKLRNQKAKLSFYVYNRKNPHYPVLEVGPATFPRGVIPSFSIEFNRLKKEGWYSILVKGYYSMDRSRINYQADFYHKLNIFWDKCREV